MKRKFRWISMLLALVLTVLSCPLPAVALDTIQGTEETTETEVLTENVTADSNVEAVAETTTPLLTLGPGEKTVEELQTMTLNYASVPEVISFDRALQKGHVNRLYAQEENLNTVTFQNTNGSKTTYIYSKPVKYVDATGTVRDKSTALTRQSNQYAMLDNSVKAYFPNQLYQGIGVEYGDYRITMRPISTFVSAEPTYSNGTVAYQNAFGSGTILTYQPRASGVKEEIVLVKDNGQYSYRFTVTMENLTPVCVDGKWYFADARDVIVGDFGSVIIRDSAGKETVGEMQIVPATAANTYTLTVTAPTEFMQASDTAYPVYIDPTTTVYEDGTVYTYNSEGETILVEYAAIEDVGVYTTTAAYNLASGTNEYHRLGVVLDGIGSIIYKLYDFYGTYGQFLNLNDHQIGAVFFYFNVDQQGIATTVSAYPMTSTWSSTVTTHILNSNLASSYVSTPSASLNLDSSSGLRSVNITEIVRAWARYNNGSEGGYNPANGFILRSDSTDSFRYIEATEATAFNNVYFEIDYASIGGGVYANNLESGQFLASVGITDVTSSTYNINRYHLDWDFNYLGNDKYLIHSMYNSNYVLYASSSSNVSFSYLPNNPSDNYIWTVSLSSNGYTIKNAGTSTILSLLYDETQDTYSVVLLSESFRDIYSYWSLILISSYFHLDSFTVTCTDWLAVGASHTTYIHANPSNATWQAKTCFIWNSSNETIATVSSAGVVTGVGNGYVNIIVTHKPTQTTYVMPITIGQVIPNGTYQIRNMYSGCYMDLEGPSTLDGAYIQQWAYHKDSQSKWLISYYGSGYYYIKSIYSNYYVAVSGSYTSNGATIVQRSSYASDACRWMITMTSSGNYKFVAKSAGTNNLSLSLPYSSKSSGINLQQITYEDDMNYTDEWFLYYDASLLSRIDEDMAERNAYVNSTKNYLNNYSSCNNFLGVNSSHFTKSEMSTIISNSKLFVIHTHGSKTAFKIGDGNQTYTVNDIKEIDMSQSKLVVFLICEGGKGGYNQTNVTNGAPTNLVEAAIYSGATTVLSFSENIWTNEADNWIVKVFEVMQTKNLTLKQAIDTMSSSGISKVAVIGGNVNITLNEVFG